MRRARGFTLIELAVALAVMAAAVSVAALSLRQSDRRALNDASRTIQADLRLAQRMAMIEGRRWGVMFDRLENRYYVYHHLPRTTVKTVDVPNGALIREISHTELVYTPRGTASTGFRIWLSKGRYWQRTTATVSGGRIEIKEIVVSTNGSKPPEGD